MTALDRDAELLARARARAPAASRSTTVVRRRARRSSSGGASPLCIVPMQTIQLLGGARRAAAFLRCAARHLQPGGVLAIAIADDARAVRGHRRRAPAPLPDICELDGVVYCEPADRGARRRRRVRARAPARDRHRRRRALTVEQDVDPPRSASIAGELEREATAAGLRAAGRDRDRARPPTTSAATVVMLACLSAGCGSARCTRT